MPSRLRRQNQLRQTHVDWIVKKMANRLKSKGHMERMVSTNRILPVGTLKRKIIKQLFSGWIRQYVGEGRVLTLKLALQVVASLRNKFSMEKLGEEQRLCEAKRMQYLLKVARKRKLSNRVQSKAMSTMDTVDTVPMEAEDFWLAQDSLFSETHGNQILFSVFDLIVILGLS